MEFFYLKILECPRNYQSRMIYGNCNMHIDFMENIEILTTFTLDEFTISVLCLYRQVKEEKPLLMYVQDDDSHWSSIDEFEVSGVVTHRR